MSSVRDRTRGAICAAALLLTVQADAKTTLVIPDPLLLRVVSNGSSFLIAADTPAKQVSVSVRQIKAPDGRELNVSEVVLDPQLIPALGPAGVCVNVTVSPAVLAEAGEYTLTIYAETAATKEKTPLLKSGTLVVPKPDISVPSLKDTTLVVHRRWPWCAAAGSNDIDLRVSGPSSVKNATFGARVTPPADAATAQGGEVTVAPQSGGSLELPAGFSRRILKITHFRNTGVFVSTLLIQPPGSTPAIEVPFKIVVTDGPLMPLLTIAAGVLLALLVQLVANHLRPRGENRLRSVELRMSIQRARAETADVGHLKALGDLEARLDGIESRNDAGAYAAAKALLDQVETDVAAQAKEVRDEQTAARSAFDQAETSLAIAKQAGADASQVDTLERRLNDVAAMINARQYKAAIAPLTAIEDAISSISGVPKVSGGVRKGRADQLVPSSKTPSLLVVDDEAARSVGRELTFVVSDPDADWSHASTIRWDWGDGSRRTDARRLRATHEYRSARTYVVTASARDVDDGETAKVSVTVTVAESLPRRFLKLRSLLTAYDLGLSLVAALVAIVTGLWVLYTTGAFGSLAQYAEAFVWGFGVDNTVRGFAAVMKKMSS
jgi:PKD domain-containing protein